MCVNELRVREARTLTLSTAQERSRTMAASNHGKFFKGAAVEMSDCNGRKREKETKESKLTTML